MNSETIGLVYFSIVKINISNVTTVLISVNDASKYGFLLVVNFWGRVIF